VKADRQTIITIAGTGTASFSGDNGPATSCPSRLSLRAGDRRRPAISSSRITTNKPGPRPRSSRPRGKIITVAGHGQRRAPAATAAWPRALRFTGPQPPWPSTSAGDSVHHRRPEPTTCIREGRGGQPAKSRPSRHRQRWARSGQQQGPAHHAPTINWPLGLAVDASGQPSSSPITPATPSREVVKSTGKTSSPSRGNPARARFHGRWYPRQHTPGLSYPLGLAFGRSRATFLSLATSGDDRIFV